MRRIYPLWNIIARKKYWIVVTLGVLFVGFFGENSLLQHARNRIQIREIQAQIDEYNARYERDEQQLKELQRNPKAMTKIAREKYFMKADDEDIFVLSDDETTQNNNNETTD